MERPRLTEFLLRLATDMETQAKFRHSKSEAVEIMEEAGLSCEQQEAVLSGETRRVQEVVILETGDLLRRCTAEKFDSICSSSRSPTTLNDPEARLAHRGRHRDSRSSASNVRSFLGY